MGRAAAMIAILLAAGSARADQPITSNQNFQGHFAYGFGAPASSPAPATSPLLYGGHLALSIPCNATGSTGVLTDCPVDAPFTFGGSGGNHLQLSLDSTLLRVNAGQLTFATQAGNTFFGVAGSSTAAPAAISCPTPGTFAGNVGGTLACTSTIPATSAPLTASAVGFGSAGGLLTGDATNLNWNDSTKYFAIGNPGSPLTSSVSLDVNGRIASRILNFASLGADHFEPITFVDSAGRFRASRYFSVIEADATTTFVGLGDTGDVSSGANSYSDVSRLLFAAGNGTTGTAADFIQLTGSGGTSLPWGSIRYTDTSSTAPEGPQTLTISTDSGGLQYQDTNLSLGFRYVNIPQYDPLVDLRAATYDLVLGYQSAPATNNTIGNVWKRSMAGFPTGNPAISPASMTTDIVDTTHDRWAVFNGSWKTYGQYDGFGPALVKTSSTGIHSAAADGTDYLSPSTGLADCGGNGIAVRTALGSTSCRTLTNTDGTISLTNPDGVAGNPVIGTTGLTPSTRTVTGTAPVAIAGDHSAHDLSANRTWSLDANGVTAAFFRQSAGNSLVGNPTGSTANVSDIGLIPPLFFSGGNLILDYDAATLILSGGTVLERAALGGDIACAAGSNTCAISANAVTNADIRQSGALSVIGRSANSTGNAADISATAASGADLRESGSTIGFGALATAAYGANSVTYAKVQQVGAASLLGNPTGSTANVSEITLGSHCAFTGTVLDCTSGSSGLADPGGNGIVVRTALNTTTNRSLTSTGATITVTNGSGVSGNPNVDLPNVGPGAVTTGTAGIQSITTDAQGRVVSAATATYLTSSGTTPGTYNSLSVASTGLINGASTTSWVAANDVLVSAGLGAVPTGDSNFTYNTSTHTLTSAGANVFGSSTGIAKLTSGTLGTATSGTDYQAPMSWPAAFDVVISPGGTGGASPAFDSNFTYNTTSHTLTSAGTTVLNTFTGLLKGTSGTVGTATSGVDFQAPLSWPAALDIVISPGGTGSAAPVGDSTFTYDTTNHILTTGPVQMNGATAPPNVSLIVGHSSQQDRDRIQFFVGFGALGATGAGDNTFIDTIPTNTTVRTGVTGGVYATQRIHSLTYTGGSGQTILEADALYIDDAPASSSLAVSAGKYAIHTAGSGAVRFDGPVRLAGVSGLGLGTTLALFDSIGDVSAGGSLGPAGAVIVDGSGSPATFNLPYASDEVYYVEISSAAIVACRSTTCWLSTGSTTSATTTHVEFPVDYTAVRGRISVNIISPTVTAGSISIVQTQNGTVTLAGPTITSSTVSGVQLSTGAFSSLSNDVFGIAIQPSVTATASGPLILAIRHTLSAL